MNSSFQRILIFLIIGVFDMSTQQNMRVAPGVPPQHYDHQQFQQPQGYQQPPPPQYQQQQQQQQYGHVQQPMGHVQQPMAHVQQPMGHVQQPMGHGQQPIIGHGQQPMGHVQQPVGQIQQPAGQVQQPVGQIPAGQVPVGGQPHGQAPHGRHHGEHAHGQLLDASNVASERKHIQEHMDLPIDTSQMSEQELQFHYFKMHDADNNNKLDGCELVKSLIHWHDHEGEGESNSLEDDQLSTVVDQVLDYDVNRDGMIDYAEFVTAQHLAQKKEEKKKCATCRD